MAETYKDIKRQLDNLTWGNPVECEYFEHSTGCDGCPAEGEYCDRKMVIHLAKRVRKATKRELNIKATESLGFPSVGKDTRVAELESKLEDAESKHDALYEKMRLQKSIWNKRQEVYRRSFKARNERIDELEGEVANAEKKLERQYEIFTKRKRAWSTQQKDYEWAFLARNERIEELEKELRDAQKVSAKRDEAADWLEAHGGIDELDKRLMPEGMEWPRFEDGEKVNVGDYIMHDGSGERVQGIYFYKSSVTLSLTGVDHEKLHTISYADTVKRPEVLAADGLPIKVGETVYGTGREQDVYTVISTRKEVQGRFSIECTDSAGEECMADPSQLTHTPPDTQKRIDDDATLHPDVYCVYILHIESSEVGDYSECAEAMALDLLRRQRELCAKGGE